MRFASRLDKEGRIAPSSYGSPIRFRRGEDKIEAAVDARGCGVWWEDEDRQRFLQCVPVRGAQGVRGMESGEV
jgi:hypothetical protein